MPAFFLLSGCAAAATGIGIAASLSTLAKNEDNCSLVTLADCRLPTLRLPGMANTAAAGVTSAAALAPNVVVVGGQQYQVTFTPVAPVPAVPAAAVPATEVNPSLDGK